MEEMGSSHSSRNLSSRSISIPFVLLEKLRLFSFSPVSPYSLDRAADLLAKG